MSKKSASVHTVTRDGVHRLGMIAEPYQSSKGGTYLKAGQVLSALGVLGSVASGAAGRRVWWFADWPAWRS